MFRIRASEVQAQIPKTATIVLVMLLVAFALSDAAIFQVYSEYRLLGEWQKRSGSVSSAEISSLRRDIGSRIIVRSTASAVLLLCTLTVVWLQQRQLAILRVLNQVKLLSLEILASMDQGVITTDLENTITGINTAAVLILGVESECIGMPLTSLGSAGASLTDLGNRVAERNAAVWDQDFAINRGGRTRRIRADAHVLKDSESRAVGGIILLRDVSDRVQMEERVHLMERFVSLGTLAAGLHHEIKNPLTALSIHVQLLEKRLGGPGPTKPVDELLGVVKSEIHRLNGVLDSFRDFASLHRLTLRPTNLVDLLEDTVRLIGPQARPAACRGLPEAPGKGSGERAAGWRQVQAGGPEPGDQRPGGDARRGEAAPGRLDQRGRAAGRGHRHRAGDRARDPAGPVQALFSTKVARDRHGAGPDGESSSASTAAGSNIGRAASGRHSPSPFRWNRRSAAEDEP